MGRRNYFIKLKHNSKSDGYHIDDIMKFVLDHNSVYDNLTEEQRKNIHELDLPGEELSTDVLIEEENVEVKKESSLGFVTGVIGVVLFNTIFFKHFVKSC